MPDAVTQFRWDYVMESGIRALMLAQALRLPGDYLPLEGLGVTDQQESVAGLSDHSLLTAFLLKCVSQRRGPMERRAYVSLRRTCSGAVSQRREAMKVAGLAVWGEAQRRTKLTDEQVPLSLSAPTTAQPTNPQILNDQMVNIPLMAGV